MYISMCLYIIIAIMVWVLFICPFIKHYTIVILCKPYNVVIFIRNFTILDFLRSSFLFLIALKV